MHFLEFDGGDLIGAAAWVEALGVFKMETLAVCCCSAIYFHKRFADECAS